MIRITILGEQYEELLAIISGGQRSTKMVQKDKMMNLHNRVWYLPEIDELLLRTGIWETYYMVGGVEVDLQTIDWITAIYLGEL